MPKKNGRSPSITTHEQSNEGDALGSTSLLSPSGGREILTRMFFLVDVTRPVSVGKSIRIATYLLLPLWTVSMKLLSEITFEMVSFLGSSWIQVPPPSPFQKWKKGPGPGSNFNRFLLPLPPPDFFINAIRKSTLTLVVPSNWTHLKFAYRWAMCSIFNLLDKSGFTANIAMCQY